MTIAGIITFLSINRTRAEETLRETNAYLENLINYANAPIIVWNPQFHITRFNHAFELLTGRSEAEVLGQSMEILFPPAIAAHSIALIRKTFIGERWETVEIKIQHRDESVRTVLWNSATLFTPDGQTPIATIAQGQDITERKQVEEKIEKLNVELSTSVKELVAFSYSVSHDLKAPLRAIAGFANILSEEYASKLDDNGRRLIGVINDNARIMGQLIDDLLKLSHQGRQAMDVVDIDVTTLVQSVCHELREELFRDRAIEVSVKPLPPARADLTLAKQIFTNLISNAMKFTAHKEKAVIEIGGYDKDGERVYYVKDNGAGFDMKYENKLFGVFQRLHAQDEFSGTGIGLAIVSNAVRRHGGTVWAEAEVGQGATFYFTLPKGV